MSESHSEITAYVASGNPQKIAEHIVVLCEREGMRRIDVSQVGHKADNGSTQDNLLRVGIFPGSPGWHLLLVNLEEFLCDRPTPDNPIRFVSLCDSLGTPGLLIDSQYSSRGTVSGNVLLEADGKGNFALSGYRWEYDKPDDVFFWHGNALDEAYAEAKPRLIVEHVPAEPDANAPVLLTDCARWSADFASKLAGELSVEWSEDSTWYSLWAAMYHKGPPVQGSILLVFERSQQNA